MASSLADPWLLSGASAFLAGAALGEGIRWLAAHLRQAERLASRRSARAVAWLALAILGAACLVSFALPLPGGLAALLPWIVAAGLSGLLAGLLPFSFGLPLLLVIIAFSALLLGGLGGQLPLRGEGPVASFSVFAAAPGLSSGELLVAERDSATASRLISLPADEAGLVIERLELSGPLGLLAGPRWYRVAGLATRAGEAWSMAESFTRGGGFMDLVLPLPGEGPAAAALPFMRRSREASPLIRLAALSTVEFRFGAGLVLEAAVGGRP
jgi:hypothetical protein